VAALITSIRYVHLQATETAGTWTGCLTFPHIHLTRRRNKKSGYCFSWSPWHHFCEVWVLYYLHAWSDSRLQDYRL